MGIKIEYRRQDILGIGVQETNPSEELKTARIYNAVKEFRSMREDIIDPLEVLQEADSSGDKEVVERVVNEVFIKAAYRGDLSTVENLVIRPELASTNLGLISAAQNGNLPIVKMTSKNASSGAVGIAFMMACTAEEKVLDIIFLLVQDPRLSLKDLYKGLEKIADDTLLKDMVGMIVKERVLFFGACRDGELNAAKGYLSHPVLSDEDLYLGLIEAKRSGILSGLIEGASPKVIERAYRMAWENNNFDLAGAMKNESVCNVSLKTRSFQFLSAKNWTAGFVAAAMTVAFLWKNKSVLLRVHTLLKNFFMSFYKQKIQLSDFSSQHR